MSILPFSQNIKFPLLSYQMDLEIMFQDHLVREKALLDYKNSCFTKWQHCIFPKGLTYDCGQKLEITPCFVLGQKISLEIMFDDRLVRKQALLHYKKANFTKWPY